jgi:hypothetical protein
MTLRELLEKKAKELEGQEYTVTLERQKTMNATEMIVIMEKSIELEEWATLRAYADRLHKFIKSGGVAPDWKAFPQAHAYYLGRYGHE